MSKKLFGNSHKDTIISALNLAGTLAELDHYAEANQILRESIPASKRLFGSDHNLTLNIRQSYARTLYLAGSASRTDLREAVAVMNDVVRRSRRVNGTHHPKTLENESALRGAKAALALAEDSSNAS